MNIPALTLLIAFVILTSFTVNNFVNKDIDENSNLSEGVFSETESLGLSNEDFSELSDIKELIEKEIFSQEEKDQSLLLASEKGNLEVVKELIEVGADVNFFKVEYFTESITPLKLAAENGHLEVVKELINAGANVNFDIDAYKKTALSLAAENGHLEVVKELIKSGASVNSKNSKDDKAPLLGASSNGHLEVVKELIKSGVDVNFEGQFGTALSAAREKQYEEIVQELVNAGAIK